MTGEWVDASIVLVIVVAIVGVGCTRESSAHTAAAALQSRVQALARVRRDGRDATVPSADVVIGDVILLSAGSIAPADYQPTGGAEFSAR